MKIKLILSLLIASIIFSLFSKNVPCLAKVKLMGQETNPTNNELTTGGEAVCVFDGRVPFRRIKTTNNNVVVDIDGTTEITIKSELDTEKNTINVDILAKIVALSNPFALLDGELVDFNNPVDFDSTDFKFSISKMRKSDGKVIEITNETPEGERTTATGNVTVTNFEKNLSTGVMRMVFENTFRTIEKLDEKFETDENGRVIVKCNFSDVPVICNFFNGCSL